MPSGPRADPRFAVMVALVACGSTQASPPAVPEGFLHVGGRPSQQSARRSASAPFYDLPGLTQIVVSSYAVAELSMERSEAIHVMRGDELVCAVEVSSSGYSCLRSDRSWSNVTLHSREPVELDVLTYEGNTGQSADLPPLCRR